MPNITDIDDFCSSYANSAIDPMSPDVRDYDSLIEVVHTATRTHAAEVCELSRELRTYYTLRTTYHDNDEWYDAPHCSLYGGGDEGTTYLFPTRKSALEAFSAFLSVIA